MAKQQPPQLQNTSQTDTTIPIKGMTKDPNSSLVGKENWTHAINAINNSDDGDVGTLGNEQANKKCGYAPFTIIGAIHLYKDKWVLFSTNNEQSEIGTWDDSECKYERIFNDYTCYLCLEGEEAPTPCLNFDTQHLITGASKENFDCSWQVYWDDGKNPSRTLNLDNIPYIQEQVTGPPVDSDECITFENTECIDCEKLRLAPLIEVPCIELSKSADGGQLRNGSYQVFIAYAINDQVVGDYYGISNIQPLFAHEDMMSGLEIKLSNLDTQFEYFQLVVVSNNQNEMQAKELGFYSTHQTDISIDYINQALKAVPLTAIPLSTPAFEKSEHMYVVNDYLIRQGPTAQYDFNYQPLANEIHTHWISAKFPSDYYKKGGNKPTFMRDEVYAFFIRFVYNTGEKSASFHIPGRGTSADFNNGFSPTNPWNFVWDGSTLAEDDSSPGQNDLSTLNWNNNGSFGTVQGDRVFEVYNTAPNDDENFWNLDNTNSSYFLTDDGGESIAEGHMAYWESTERYPNDPVRWNGVSGNPYHDLCGKPIRHHKFPDETFSGSGPGGFLDRADTNGEHIHILGVNFWNIKWPRYSDETGAPTGELIPNIIGYEILVGSREGNRSIIAKGIARNMREYKIPADATGKIDENDVQGFIPNYPFNSAQKDPFLSYADGYTWNDNTAVEYDTHNWFPYGPGWTAKNLFTLHSPELSFNRPFLSPFEIRTYGLTFGTSIGRFIPSEKHPKQKLLRNISMWVALMVGIGYAIMEMRGKRKKKMEPPRALSIGLDGKQDERTGGSDTNTLTPGTLVPGSLNPAIPPATVSGTSGTSGNIDTSQGGNAAETAAPATGNESTFLDLDINQRMMDAYATDAGVTPNVGATTTEGARDTALTTASMIGAPKLAMTNPTGISFESTTREAYSAYTSATNFTDRGYIGAGQTIEYEGSRFESAPGFSQLLFGIFNFMNFTAEGGQHIIDLIYNLVSYQDYAYKYGGHGLYLRTDYIDTGHVHRMLVNKARYIGSTIQNLSANVRVNNLQRPSTVALLADTWDDSSSSCFNLPGPTQDDSRFIIGDFNGWYNPSQWRISPIAAHYISLKVAFRNQYGQIDQIKQLPTDCSFKFKDTLQNPGDYYFVGTDNTPLTNPCAGITCPPGQMLDPNTCTCMDYIVIGPAGTGGPSGSPVDQNTRFRTPTIFGGDCYINRYTEKVIMPFFWDFLSGQPDGFPYDYRLRSNVPRPIYWMNSAKYDLSELVRYITSFAWLSGSDAAGMMDQSPNQLFFLDRADADRTQDGLNTSDPGGFGNTAGPEDGGLPNESGIAVDPITDPGGGGGKSLFHIKSGYMYTHVNGIQDFFAESTINVGLRDWEDVKDKKHYDFTEFTDTEALFHSDIVREDNFYKYDASLSKTRFNTQLVSWGLIQPRDYDPLVAEFCFTHYPKRLIYSLQAQKEAKKDFWRVFLPMNYKDFKNRVNVIKPISKSGAIVLFPNLAPTLFQGVDQLQTDLGTKLTIGDGGLFSQPMQNIVNAEAAHEYGSCESARSVVNTPSGVFYISQAQGKIFQYNGQGIVNIANQGMKQWFNKYLPSVLLNQFPELEECNGWIDNPVAGVGCQTVYDPNYDIVYFCKKDYEAINPECIEFVPCEGFYWNETECGEMEETASCPFGYTYNPNNPVGQECELITQIPADIRENPDPIELDLVFVVGAGAKTKNTYLNRSNVGNMQQIVGGIIAGLQDELNQDLLRIGLCHYGGGRNNRSPLFGGQYDPNTPDDPDKMFEPAVGTFTSGSGGYGNQITLTNDTNVLMDWLGQSQGQIGDEFGYEGDYLPDYESTYGKAADAPDKPPGNDIAAGMWVGQNLLYGAGSRTARKILILVSDHYAYNTGADAGRYSTFQYTNEITGTDIFAPDGQTSMSVSPLTADMDIGPKVEFDETDGDYSTNWALNDNHASWVNTNILNNSDYQNNAFQQITMNIAFYTDLPEGVTILSQSNYLEQFCDNNQYYQINNLGQVYYNDDGSVVVGPDGMTPQFDTSIIENSILDNVESIVSQIIGIMGTDPPPAEEPCPDENCELVYNGDDPMCECITYVPAEFSSVKLPIDITDENYFRNVSWTVSYDPKAQAWISFHDWHPDLTIPSLNHFFTTKNFIDLSDPQCPPGFEYDPITMGCCQTNDESAPANVIIEEAVPVVNVIPQACPLDIVFAVDVTGSTISYADGDHAYADTVFGFFQDMVDQFVTVMADDMWNGAVQVGLMNWSGSFPLQIQNQSGGNNNGSNKTPQPAGATSFISMSNWVGNQVTPPVLNPDGSINVPGVYDYMYDDGVNPPEQRLWGTFCEQTQAGTNTGPAFERAQQQLSDVTASALGDRTMNPQYKRVLVFLTDGNPYPAPPTDEGSNTGRDDLGVFTPNVDCNNCGGCYDSSGCNYSDVLDGDCDSLEANWIVGGAYKWPYCGQGERFQNTMNSCIPSDPDGAGQGHPYWTQFPYPEMARCTAWNSGLIGSPDLDSTTIGIMGWADDTGFYGNDLDLYISEVVNNCFYRLLANEGEGVWGLSGDVYYPEMTPPTVTSFIEELRNSVLCEVRNCICPDNYVRVSTPASMNPEPYDAQIIGSILDNCEGSEGSEANGVCRHIYCECDEDLFGPNYIEDSFFESGTCDVDVSSTAIADIWGISTIFGVGIGDPAWDNPDPLMCNWQTLCCIDPSYDKGGLWKHNDRCDLFTNYYEFDYPWEVEIVESKGQTVNTVRSVEYQLESYIYNGNLNDNCGDRFHDLDWNFDEVIIHNTEQVSGLLRLDLSPKNDVPLITQYPIITGNDITILYSKEEQKYRFNQFWDITDDRGEFSQASQSIFLTELNGYIRELNQANLNYFKPAFERKKFRHYWNKVLFRRSTSENRKMILKLANTKINASFR